MAAKPRVLHLVLSLNPGGTERIVIELVKQLADCVHALVGCLDDKGRWAEELEPLGVAVFELNRRPGFQPRLARSIGRHVAAHRVDIVHCHHYSPFVYGMLTKVCQPHLGIVFTEHGRLSDAKASLKRIVANQIIGRLPGRFFSVSANLREHLLSEGFPARRVSVIHNGIDPGPPPGEDQRRRARASLGLSEDAFVLGTVARLDPVKDLGTMIRGFAWAQARQPPALLVIVGEGDEREPLTSLAKSLDLRERVVFTGHRDDARELLPAFDLYLNSSVTEGISITILEAMAAKLAVIASNVGGTPEIIDSHCVGTLVGARSPEALGEAIVSLRSDPQHRARLALAGRDRVSTHFAIATMAGNYLGVYRALMSD